MMLSVVLFTSQCRGDKMYRYTGDFEHLKQLGFIMNAYGGYWFLPTGSIKNCPSPLTVNIEDRIIEFANFSQLEIIKDYLEKVSK